MGDGDETDDSAPRWPATLSAQFGAELRRLRKLRGLSQTDVTVLLGWSSQNYISELECGKANPTAAQMQALARKLGGNVRVFIELDTKDP